jgi:hypothetical protein
LLGGRYGIPQVYDSHIAVTSPSSGGKSTIQRTFKRISKDIDKDFKTTFKGLPPEIRGD